jgi:hypothetical protein
MAAATGDEFDYRMNRAEPSSERRSSAALAHACPARPTVDRDAPRKSRRI